VDIKVIESVRRLDIAQNGIYTREDRAELLTDIYLDDSFPEIPGCKPSSFLVICIEFT
jgi:hypothetical protein